MLRSVRWLVLVGLAVSCAAGCGSSAGSVSGKVTFEGNSLQTGVITFVPTKGNPVTSAVTDGRYAVDNVPLGEAKITITVPMAVTGPAAFAGKGGVGWEKKMPPKDAPVPPGFDPKKGNAPASVKIPTQYADASTTPLKHTVVSGKQEKDIEIK